MVAGSYNITHRSRKSISLRRGDPPSPRRGPNSSCACRCEKRDRESDQTAKTGSPTRKPYEQVTASYTAVCCVEALFVLSTASRGCGSIKPFTTLFRKSPKSPAGQPMWFTRPRPEVKPKPNGPCSGCAVVHRGTNTALQRNVTNRHLDLWTCTIGTYGVSGVAGHGEQDCCCPHGSIA